MPVETKKHIFTFIDSLKVSKRGHLYNMIVKHVEENKKIKDPFTDESPAASKTVIHSSESVCTSCEG